MGGVLTAAGMAVGSSRAGGAAPTAGRRRPSWTLARKSLAGGEARSRRRRPEVGERYLACHVCEVEVSQSLTSSGSALLEGP
jgi:hypothetical protein